MKDSITSRLLAKDKNVGKEASGSSGQPLLSTLEETKVYLMVGDDAEEKEQLAPVANKTEKGKLLRDLIVESLW